MRVIGLRGVLDGIDGDGTSCAGVVGGSTTLDASMRVLDVVTTTLVSSALSAVISGSVWLSDEGGALQSPSTPVTGTDNGGTDSISSSNGGSVPSAVEMARESEATGEVGVSLSEEELCPIDLRHGIVAEAGDREEPVPTEIGGGMKGWK